VLPFPITDGWPVALPGCVTTIRESGITLGTLLLEDDEWQTLRSGPVFSMRVDDHPLMDGWTAQHPDGAESHVEFEIPLAPVLVPSVALTGREAFSDWVMDTHGALGRLLIWDESRRWWMAQEPDLELVITSAPAGMFAQDSDELSWLSFGTGEGRQKVDELCARYGVIWME
jgi:hypothetical protein